MHYYKKNLGDYAKKTGRLSLLQHGAYTLLIDACYDREQFPTLDDAMDWLLPINDEERQAIEFVLKRFFTLEGDVYVQNRIKEEITDYKAKALKNKLIAQEREKAKRTKRERNVHDKHQDREPNQEPRTKNQEPNKKNKQKNKAIPSNAKEVEDYAKSIDYFVDGQQFIDHYEANGWMRGKSKIKCWKACLRTWKRNDKDKPQDETPQRLNYL